MVPLLRLAVLPRKSKVPAITSVQDLLKRVAYETLSKTDRKARHVAAARHISTAWADEEIVEIVVVEYDSRHDLSGVIDLEDVHDRNLDVRQLAFSG